MHSPPPEATTFIKICGITRLGDARVAVAAGANAVGFIFARSLRRVTPSRAAAITVRLHPSVRRIGVFVNAPQARVLEVVNVAALDGVQLQGSETPEFVEALRRAMPSLTIFKVVRPRSAADLRSLSAYAVDAIMLDPRDPERPFDPVRPIPTEWLAGVDQGRFVVAGGLTADNVAALVGTLRPWGVDVSGGVESAPGRKDPNLVRGFVRAVREAERCR